MSDFRTIGRAAVLLSALLAGGSSYAAESQPPAAPSAEAPSAAPAAQPRTWPRVLQEGAETLTMYQPQIEKWDDATITFRAAIAVETAAPTAGQPAEGAEPVYGMVRTSARADVDKAARTVTLHDFQIVKVSFPTAPEKDAPYLAILTQQLPTGAKEISLDRLEAGAAVSQAVKQQRALGVNNDPPCILFSTTPALLVLVDGDPVLRAMGGVTSVAAEQVINTHALIVKVGGAFYLTALNDWYEAPAIGGPWNPLANPPAFLAQVRQAAGDQVDLMQPETAAAPLEAPPAVYVSTVPAELIQTDGAPQFIPIADTELLQAQNSDDAIFLDAQIGEYFVLISGRWFKSASLDSGQWQFISARDLPADFAKIPTDNPRANVLVSVPGTPEAQEALIANAIPQTATVTRGPGTPDLTYDAAADGAPQFQPVEGDPSLQYAVNASLPVIETAPDSFYCVQNGIWFNAPAAAGPWAVATEVPPAIYAIPLSCPLHYVTYCRIYGFTPQVVYCGYTPGYFGTVVSTDGVVVYGTGYWYRRHIGRAWIAQPCTYGFSADFACGPDTGFAFGFAEGLFAGGCPEPYWGPYDWGWRHHFNYSHISINHMDVYEHWHGNVVSIPQRGGRGEEENARLHPQAPFNPYSARTTTLQHARSVAAATPAARQPAAKPAKLDWSANAKPRTQSLAEATKPAAPAHEAEPKAETRETAPSTPAPATSAEKRQAQVARQNNVFVSATGDVYRRTPAAKTAPAAKPAPATATRETPAAKRPTAQPAQWEQETKAGWKPAAESPAFQKAAPELNREAAARETGESRVASRPAATEARPSTPIVTSRPSAPAPASAPPARQDNDSTRGRR